MKKILGMLMIFMLFGCTLPSNNEQTPNELNWDGEYIYNEIILSIEKTEIDENGFMFNFKKDEKTLTNYAFFQEDDSSKAIYDIEEDGHTLIFTLKNNQITVRELEGPSILGTDLTGQYKKK